MEAIEKWISQRVSEILGVDDEVTESYVVELLKEKEVSPKSMQVSLTPMLFKDTPQFMEQLWDMLLDAQKMPDGIPSALAKKEVISVAPVVTSATSTDSVQQPPQTNTTELTKRGDKKESEEEKRDSNRHKKRSRSRSRSHRRSRSPSRHHHHHHHRYHHRSHSRSRSRSHSRSRSERDDRRKGNYRKRRRRIDNRSSSSSEDGDHSSLSSSSPSSSSSSPGGRKIIDTEKHRHT